jgi:hypothetical protein
MNEFQLDFFSRLRAWNTLRATLENQPTQEICLAVDEFWQKAPQSNHYLHPVDIEKWPDPWQLLNDNLYCPYSRAGGMIYTLAMLGIQDIVLADASDYNSISVVLVLVDHAKYILNYWPGTVVNNKLSDFTVVRHYDITPIIQKTGTL